MINDLKNKYTSFNNEYKQAFETKSGQNVIDQTFNTDQHDVSISTSIKIKDFLERTSLLDFLKSYYTWGVVGIIILFISTSLCFSSTAGIKRYPKSKYSGSSLGSASKNVGGFEAKKCAV